MALDEEEVDRRLAKLRVSAEAATSNLIELEDLGTLSLLRAGECTGALGLRATRGVVPSLCAATPAEARVAFHVHHCAWATG